MINASSTSQCAHRRLNAYSTESEGQEHANVLHGSGEAYDPTSCLGFLRTALDPPPMAASPHQQPWIFVPSYVFDCFARTPLHCASQVSFCQRISAAPSASPAFLRGTSLRNRTHHRANQSSSSPRPSLGLTAAKLPFGFRQNRLGKSFFGIARGFVYIHTF